MERRRWNFRTMAVGSAVVMVAGAALGAGGAGPAVAANPSGDLSFSVVRLAGADRYATAVQVSKRFFSTGTPVAYIATGTNFPDALAAGPAAAKLGGPVLFVGRDTVPAVTRSELVRLNPGVIKVVGGPDVVSESVRATLAGLSAGGATRLTGPDRYQTAVAVSKAVREGLETAGIRIVPLTELPSLAP